MNDGFTLTSILRQQLLRPLVLPLAIHDGTRHERIVQEERVTGGGRGASATQSISPYHWPHDNTPIQLRMEEASITIVPSLAGGQNSCMSIHFIQTAFLLPRRLFGGIISTSTGRSISMNNYLIWRMTLENWMFYSIAQIQCTSKSWNIRDNASLSLGQSLTAVHQLSCNLNIYAWGNDVGYSFHNF